MGFIVDIKLLMVYNNVTYLIINGFKSKNLLLIMDQPGVADKYQMELIKMFKRMINSLKYTQSSICLAYAKAVRSQ